MSHYGHTTVSGFRAPGRECSIDPGEPHNSTWSGLLPQKYYSNPVYSCKIFLGGVPWDVTEVSLVQAFSPFGNIRIEWPGKDQSPSPPKALCVFSAKIQNFFAPWLFVNEWPQYGLVWMWTHGNVNFWPQKLSYGL